MRENRGPWYLLTGLVVGAVAGLLYAWAVQPVQYTNTTPASLRADFRDQYRALIASAYVSNGDLVRAQARLNLLRDADTYRVLAEQAQRTLADGNSPEEARALGLLAAALSQAPATVPASPPKTAITETRVSSPTPSPTGSFTPSILSSLTPAVITATATKTAFLTGTFTPTPVLTSTVTTVTATLSATNGSITSTVSSSATPTRTPRGTMTPSLTGTPPPTRTPTITPGAPFVLEKRETVCNQALGEALIQVQAYDAANNPVPGLEAVITWDGGEDHFFTGLKPELGLGYADFTMTPGVTYTLYLAHGGQPIEGLTTPECELRGEERFWGSWRMTFVQP